MAKHGPPLGGPPTHVPPNAQGAFRDMLAMPWYTRVRHFLMEPDPQTINDLILAGFASFTPAQAYDEIRNGRDAVGHLVKRAHFENFVARPWFRMVIRRNRQTIFRLLIGHANDPESGPVGILNRMRRSGSWHASIFSSPAGWAWLCWTCHHLAVYLQTYARIKDWPKIGIPPMPNPIRPVGTTNP